MSRNDLHLLGGRELLNRLRNAQSKSTRAKLAVEARRRGLLPTRRKKTTAPDPQPDAQLYLV